MNVVVQSLSVAGGAMALGATAIIARHRHSTGSSRARIQWLAVGLVATLVAIMVGLVLHFLIGWPSTALAGAALGCIVLPGAYLVGRSANSATHAPTVLVESLVVAGLIALVGGIYVLVVIGLGRSPEDDERTLIALSMLAAALATVLAVPARRSLEEWANQRVYGERHSPDEAVKTFGGRMSRAVPMDELLLQLVESLKKTMQLTAAEMWTGTDGHLSRTVSVPDRGPAQLRLSEDEVSVVARAHAQGNAWLRVWVPQLLADRGQHLVRSVAVAHMGELLGLIVVERAEDDAPFTEDEDRALVELARQVGLALHNVRLDSALQASLEELQEANDELVASRARIVAAADESRRQIERNLHDGAQQHLVALAVKIGLVKQLLESDPVTAQNMFGELRDDVQAALTELRDLAHGIYPPLLRDRGLAEALRTAANRSPLPATVDAAEVGRYDGDIEAAVYFCCLEAMQNAGKYAGEDASITVAVGNGEDSLWFDVRDDGAGFDPAVAATGHGFVNMRDRLGAMGGTLTVQSDVAQGTRISGVIPVEDRPPPVPNDMP